MKKRSKKILTLFLCIFAATIFVAAAFLIWRISRQQPGGQMEEALEAGMLSAQGEAAAANAAGEAGETENAGEAGHGGAADAGAADQNSADSESAAGADIQGQAGEMEGQAQAGEGSKEGLPDLKAALEGMLSGYSGTWSVYVEDLDTRESLSINSGPMKAASLIKLYIMGAVYQAIGDGSLEMTDEISRLLTDMITVSHNESSNELVRRLSPTGLHEDGMPVVNAFAQANAYGDTSQGRDLQDSRDVPPPGENYTSVNDCGKFLADVYRGVCVSEDASRQMESLLQRQERTWKIPAGLPEGVRTANKTGELSATENDVAIVYGKEQGASDYILCVMADELPDTSQAQENIRSLSGMVYQYFLGN